jgi:hypothetical protein
MTYYQVRCNISLLTNIKSAIRITCARNNLERTLECTNYPRFANYDHFTLLVG